MNKSIHELLTPPGLTRRQVNGINPGKQEPQLGSIDYFLPTSLAQPPLYIIFWLWILKVNLPY